MTKHNPAKRLTAHNIGECANAPKPKAWPNLGNKKATHLVTFGNGNSFHWIEDQRLLPSSINVHPISRGRILQNDGQLRSQRDLAADLLSPIGR